MLLAGRELAVSKVSKAPVKQRRHLLGVRHAGHHHQGKHHSMRRRPAEDGWVKPRVGCCSCMQRLRHKTPPNTHTHRLATTSSLNRDPVFSLYLLSLNVDPGSSYGAWGGLVKYSAIQDVVCSAHRYMSQSCRAELNTSC